MGTLTATYTLPDGTPEVGAITFQLSARVVESGTPQVYTEGPVTAYLDQTGSISVQLVAVDHPDIQAEDLVYVVTEQVTSRPSTQYLISPTGDGP